MNNKLQDKYVKEMSGIDNDDTETAHREADHLLCEILEKLGYQKLVDEYREIPKWYA